MSDPAIASAQRSGSRYYGKYRGFVNDNNDPEQLGRLRLLVPSVLADQPSAWALPCLPFGGSTNTGFFLVPEVGAQVWVEFEEGNVDAPIWTGTFWQQASDVPQEGQKAPPTTRVLRTPSGHVLNFDDEQGKERIRLHHKGGAELLIDEQGTVTLTDQAGSKLTLDAQSGSTTLHDNNGSEMKMDAAGVIVKDAAGNEIKLAASGITIKGAQIVIDAPSVALGGSGGEPLIKGASFLPLYMTHVHTCTAPGSPSSPPIPQGEMSTLTSSTRGQ